MKIEYGNGSTKFGPGVDIKLTGSEVATAISSWLVAHGVHIDGAKTIKVNEELIKDGRVYVDPEGFVIDYDGRKFLGSESAEENQCLISGTEEAEFKLTVSINGLEALAKDIWHNPQVYRSCKNPYFDFIKHLLIRCDEDQLLAQFVSKITKAK